MLYRSRLLVPLIGALLGACATAPAEPEGPPRKETVWAVTDAGELIRFNAGQPRRILDRKPLQGLPAGDRLVGIDYRVARGQLYALSAKGQLYRLDTANGALAPLGAGVVLAGGTTVTGFDFNPVADRIRVTTDQGLNLRLHPDTGALASADPAPAYVPGDASAGRTPRLAGVAYTYNKQDEKLTTNYAIDVAAGTLVMQGSKEGVQPVVSPNTGKLTTVGTLQVGPVDDATFDIADINNAALAALRSGPTTRLYTIDLSSGQAQLIGTVGDGRALWGMAIEP